MTRSDILIDSDRIIRIIDASNLSEKEKNDCCKVIANFSETLDKEWCLMLSLGSSLENLEKKEDNLMTNSFKKILTEIRRNILNNFGEKN